MVRATEDGREQQTPGDDPRDWLGGTPLLDLDDPKLRLKARSLTQLGRTDRQKALAIYAYVKRLPYAKRIKLEYPRARDVIEQRSGDGDDKATLFIALLRVAGIPARIRYMEMKGAMLRGLVPSPNPPQDGRTLLDGIAAGKYGKRVSLPAGT